MRTTGANTIARLPVKALSIIYLMAVMSALAGKADLWFAPCWAEEAVTGGGSAELQSLMQKVFLAYGGRDNLSKLDTNYVLLGEQTAAGEPGSSINSVHFRQTRKDACLRIDMEPGNDAATVSTIYDGMSAWKMVGKVVEELPADQTNVLRCERDHSPAVLRHLGEPGYSFRLNGRTTYRATPAYAIEVTHDGFGFGAETIFVDEKNYLVDGITYKSSGSDSKTTGTDVTIDYGQYRIASGTLFPFKQTQLVGDKPAVELNVTSLDTGGVVDNLQFRRPDRPDEIRLAKSVAVPFDYSHKEIVVKVRINDSEPLDFLFDTAASQTVVDRRVAAESFLSKQGSYPVTTAGGTVPTEMTTVKKLLVGEAELSDIQALILDLTPQARQMGKHIAGILGANVLQLFAVTIDYGNSQIILSDATAYKPPAGSASVPFSQKQGPIIKALLNGGNETSFLIDTGAAFNNLPAKTAKNFIAGQSRHTTEGTGLDGRPVKLATLKLNSVKIGNQVVKGVNFTYSVESDSQSQASGFVQSANAGVLGNPFWQNFLLTFDYKFQRLILQTNPIQTGRQEVEQMIAAGDTKLAVYRDLRTAEAEYEKALLRVQALGDAKLQARVWGRIGNLRRVMAKDLNRPEQGRIAYEYFSKAQELAHKLQDREAEGRILADWSLLYLDNGQTQAAQQALQGATFFSPQDPQVNVDYAVYLYKMQLYPDMQKYIEKALFLDPANWQALWYKVKLAEMFSDPAQLKDTLKEILKYYPWSKLAREKLTALTNPPPAAPAGTPLTPGALNQSPN